MENTVLEIIFEFLKGVKEGNAIKCDYESKHYQLSSCRYLLGQIIRQYKLPASHIFISTEAKTKWEKLSTTYIRSFSYRDYVKCDKDTSTVVKRYTGGSNNFIEEPVGKGFTYRDIFHDEHIIPVNIIIDRLLKTDLSFNSIEKELNGIYICKMLKSEDRNIKEKKKRPACLISVVETYYKNAGINIIDWEQNKAAYIANNNCGNLLENNKEYTGCIGCDLFHSVKNAPSVIKKEEQSMVSSVKRTTHNFSTNEFIIKNDYGAIRNHKGYKFYDTAGRNLGICIKTMDDRTPAFHNGEFCFFPQYEERLVNITGLRSIIKGYRLHS